MSHRWVYGCARRASTTRMCRLDRWMGHLKTVVDDDEGSGQDGQTEAPEVVIEGKARRMIEQRGDHDE